MTRACRSRLTGSCRRAPHQQWTTLKRYPQIPGRLSPALQGGSQKSVVRDSVDRRCQRHVRARKATGVALGADVRRGALGRRCSVGAAHRCWTTELVRGTTMRPPQTSPADRTPNTRKSGTQPTSRPQPHTVGKGCSPMFACPASGNYSLWVPAGRRTFALHITKRKWQQWLQNLDPQRSCRGFSPACRDCC
jgi:hypothetical protein